jgi:ribosomal protein L32
MVTCPVCETQQPPAEECVNCGVRLSRAAVAEVAVEVSRVDGLEATALDEGTPVAAAPSVDGLETTRIDDPLAAMIATERIAEVESTAIDDPLAAMVTAERIPDMEATREDFQRDTGGEVAANAPCVYCGHVQESGRTCDNCGRMRTRVIVNAPAAAEVVEEVEIVDGLERCRSCGGRVRPAPLCSECGRPLPVAEI